MANSACIPQASHRFPKGVWPVMLTPFSRENEVDQECLDQLVGWYIHQGVSGLFAVCQSSEMFCLSLQERLSVASTVVKASNKRLPVIASGHVSDSFTKQIEEINAMADTGVDAVVLLVNRFAKEDEDDAAWMRGLEQVLTGIRPNIPLGLYECPHPYHRLLSNSLLSEIARIPRFHFLKDTSCDLIRLRERQKIAQGSNLQIFNAHAATLLPSLRSGIAGFSGIMANFHPDLYVWLCQNIYHPKAEAIQEFLSLSSLVERQYYPPNAKYALSKMGVAMETTSRLKSDRVLNDLAKLEIDHLLSLSQRIRECLRST